mgnify:CR=1|jgi:hypothetical protein
MKKNIFIMALFAIALCLNSCQREEVTPGNNGSSQNTPRVTTTSDLSGTNWTATISLDDLVYAMTGTHIGDYGCELGADSAMVYHLNFGTDFAHITFSDNISVYHMADVAGEYTLEEIQQMNFAYYYDGSTHTGTLTAVGIDENGDPINYQISFTYNDTTDEITIILPIADENDNAVNFPAVFHRDAVI